MKYSQATTSLLIASAALATAEQVNEKIMVDDNVQIKQASAAASTATAQFANAPLSTAVVTDANGATVTSYVWWEPSTTAKESAATSAKQSAASSAATSSVKQSSATAKQSTASSAATSAKQSSASSAAPSATSALFANAPLSTAITTDANGATITSYVWWLPSTTASPSASAHSSGQSSAQASAQSSVTSRNWDQPLFTSTYTLVNGAVTTQEIWWVPSGTSNSLVQSSTAADASNVSTSAQTYTSNGSTFTTHTLVTMAAKLNANHSMNTSSAHYTVVNGTTQAINGAGAYKDSIYLAFGAAVIGLLV